MTLQASGAISMSQINTELGTAVNNLLHSWVRLLANVPSGPVSYSNLYSKTGHFTGAINLSAATVSTSLTGNKFFTGTMDSLLRNASDGLAELDFSVAPNWTSTIFLTNNTTGISSTLTAVNAQSWKGANPANLLRASQNDNFTIRPI